MRKKKKFLLEDSSNLQKILKKIKDSKNIFLFLDYDGTLTDIKKIPSEAKLEKKTLSLIKKISNNTKIFLTIVSGRTIDDLVSLIGIAFYKKINLVGTHGAEIKIANEEKYYLCDMENMEKKIKELKKDIMKLINGCPNFLLEDKKITLSIHYRNCEESELKILPDIINFLNIKKNKYKINSLFMKKVIEIMPFNINKGNSIEMVHKYYNRNKESITVCIGDDITDENLFLKNKNDINIKVTNNFNEATHARYFLRNPDEVNNFLTFLI